MLMCSKMCKQAGDPIQLKKFAVPSHGIPFACENGTKKWVSPAVWITGFTTIFPSMQNTLRVLYGPLMASIAAVLSLHQEINCDS